MKKIFLSLFALIAIVGMVNAQRVWAYGLNLEQSGDELTFTFISTNDDTDAKLLFVDENGDVKGEVTVNDVVEGENVVDLTLNQIPATGTLNWAVELSADAIDEVYEVTEDKDDFYFYLSQGVATNNNPQSPHFGKIYVANPVSGKEDGLSKHSQTQKNGIYVFDPLLNLENYGEGYTPLNVSFTDGWDAIHRIAVSPVDGTVAFVKWDVEPFTVYTEDPDSLDMLEWWDEATDITPTLNQPVAICYDKEGTLCVLCYDGKGETSSIYSIYKMTDTIAEPIFTQEGWIVSGRSSIASDGRGGYWVASKPTDNATHTGKFMHVSEYGIDMEITTGDAEEGFPENFNRAQVAYDIERDILALGGGGKVTLFNVTYDEYNEPTTLTKWLETPMFNEEKPKWNTDGIAFDYAGDIIVMCASNERFYKFALPTDENTCTTPAPLDQIIKIEAKEDGGDGDGEKEDSGNEDGEKEDGEEDGEEEGDAVTNTYVSSNQNRKQLINGQLYITRQGKLYNALGQQMQ